MSVEEYIEGLVISQGQGAGEPFRLLPWQRRFLRGALRPEVRTAALSVPRGAGKSTLLAGLAAACVDGPLRRRRGEVIVVASRMPQARVIFEHALAFLGLETGKDHPRGDWKVWNASNQTRIQHLKSGALVRCIGSEPAGAHGLAPALVLADEPSQWDRGSRDAMIAALRTGLGKIPGSKLVVLGTRSNDSSHFFERMLEGGADYIQLHCADTKDNPFHKRTWLKANPSLKFMPDLLAATEEEAKLAKRDPALLASFRALRLNQGVSDVVVGNMLLDVEDWKRCEGLEAERDGDYVLGVDLGGGAAMSACAAYWPLTGRVEAFASFPDVPTLQERGIADGVGDLYQQMYERGELLLQPGMAVDVEFVLRNAIEQWGYPLAIAADRWKDRDLYQAMAIIGVDLPFVPRGTGFKDGDNDVKTFRRAVLKGHVAAPESLLMRAALSEARIVMDVWRNEKLAKSSQGGRRQRARDDTVAAMLQAVGVGYRLREQEQAFDFKEVWQVHG